MLLPWQPYAILAQNRCIFTKEILIFAMFHTFLKKLSFATLKWICLSIMLSSPFQKQQNINVIVFCITLVA